MAETLVIRADATVALGTGHAMRCLALAQAWQDSRGDVVFAMVQATPAIEQRLALERCAVVRWDVAPGSAEDAQRVIELAEVNAARWTVVDGYHFQSDYQRRIKAAGLKLLFVDDAGDAGPYVADLILNQNAYAEEDLYAGRDKHTRLLLGPSFALLRREFVQWRERNREIQPAGRRVLVTMGGSDPDNLTLRIIQALGGCSTDLEATVVVGGSNPHLDSLQAIASTLPGTVRLVRDASNMPELMSRADLAIAGAGSVCGEICLLGLPAILIDIAPNQKLVAETLDRLGAAVHIGCSETAIPDRLAKMVTELLDSSQVRAALSQKALSLVAGGGAQRVIEAMRASEVQLRPAEQSDCSLLWEWTNQPDVRSASFSQEPVPWERHVQWFNSKLSDSNARLLVATDSTGAPVGVVRFQLEGTRAIVSISIDKNSRGRGYGQAILSKAVADLFQSTQASAVDAYVRPENEASLRLFSSTGFERASLSTVHGESAVHLVLRRNGV